MNREDAIVWLNTDDYESAGFQIALEMAIKALEQEQQADNEWCTDCKEYDHEKHCCPRFSQVIKTTLQECCEDAISCKTVIEWLKSKDIIKLSSQEDAAWKELKALSSVKLQDSILDKYKALEQELNRWSLDDAINRIFKRMWNCRGKHTTNIDKVKMEQIIRDELPFVTQTAISRKADNLCDSCTNAGCEFQSGIIRTTCTFYMPPHIEPDDCGNYVVQEPTTKNGLGVDWDELKRKILMEVDGGTDDKWLSYADVCDNISNSIDDFKADLPSATPQQPRWIFVSERLPERSGEYLVSVIDGSGEDNDYEAVRVAWFAHKKVYNIKESEWRELGIDETVIAWMPLPESCKVESEG